VLPTGNLKRGPNLKNDLSTSSARLASLLLALSFVGSCGGRAASEISQPAALPDLNGVWSAPFTPDISKALGHQPPFTPYGAARFAKEDEIDDPLTKCLPIGPARGIQAGIMPFQIVQTPSVFTILFENQHTFRIIHTDGRSHPKDLDPTWFGDSIGKWDGDTLIVDTVGIDDRTWLDTAGHEHSDQLHLVERFQKMDSNNIKWTVTFEDGKYFTEPWAITLPIARQNTEIMSYSCEENEKDRAHLRRTKK
jgi:hypothetical protein